jgi:predicted nucleic acid-binding protein
MLDDVVLVDVDEEIADRAWDLAGTFRLRGYDAVHLASFERVEAGESVLVAADGALADAGRSIGYGVAVPGG